MNADLNLAQKLYDTGDAVGSEEKCLAMLSRAEDIGGAYLLLARISYDRREYVKSLKFLADVERNGPAPADAAYLAGLNHYARHDLTKARASFVSVLADGPGNGDAHRNLGLIDREGGNSLGAVLHFCRALDIEPGDTLTRRNLFDTLGSLQSSDWAAANANGYAGDIRRHLEAGFRMPDLDMKKYFPAAAAAILNTGHFRLAIAALGPPASGNVSPIVDQAWFSDLTGDPLVQAVLASDILAKPVFETVLTNIREGILSLAVNDDALLDDIPLAFCVALAHQAYLTEYAYFAGTAELVELRHLQQELSSKIGSRLKLSTKDAVKLAISASYVPLGGWMKSLPETLNQGELESLGQLQIFNPRREAAFERRIETLSPISERTSANVKTQYEQNPFPRWSLLTRPRPGSVGETLQFLFPNFQPSEKLSRPCSILIAGCGTGHQPILEALRYPASKLTAVDLSRTSLAYAMRKAELHGTHNIQFIEADILELGELDREFDVIECTGVLHHMADPLTGWRILNSRLAPGGVMKIALYSKQARRHITEARRWIEDQDLPPAVQTIRDVRRKILDLAADDPKRKVTGFTDFYSISGARDLLFHVQEHTFTLPEIKNALHRFELELIGMQILDDGLKDKFGAEFPGDAAMADLDNWHRFEMKNPDSFRGMYTFWCRKAEPVDALVDTDLGQVS